MVTGQGISREIPLSKNEQHEQAYLSCHLQTFTYKASSNCCFISSTDKAHCIRPYLVQFLAMPEEKGHTVNKGCRLILVLMYQVKELQSKELKRLEFALCILNMVLSKKVDKTPYELWYGKVPSLSHLKVLGCEALVKWDTSDKLQQRSVKCIFIGYPKQTMGYYFYFPSENKIVVARYTEFLEKNIISQEFSRRVVKLKEIQDEDTSPSENTSEIPMEVEGD
nr:hypothetical protein [Tanacetum cinerariifolium]